MKTLTGSLIPRRLIEIPEEYERKDNLVEDDALRNSIRSSGIQQPLIVLSTSGGRYTLIDGFRRWTIASELGIEDVPAVIDAVPDGEDPRRYQDRIRFFLDEHRQDLFPSQRAELITKLKEMFRMKNKDVAGYLGVDAGSITNWLAIQKYSPEIVKAIDAGEFSMFAARAFDGMTEEAQDRLFRKHRKDIADSSGKTFHKLIRSTYPPKSFPQYYRNPEATAEKLKRKQTGRQAKSRPSLSRDEKKRLARDLALQETELRDSKAELQKLNREIIAATIPIRAILRDKELSAMLSDDQREEFERFAEVYI